MSNKNLTYMGTVIYVSAMPLIEKKPKPDNRARKGSYAFYLSKGLVDDLARISKETGRSKSEVLELLARAGVGLHEGDKK